MFLPKDNDIRKKFQHAEEQLKTAEKEQLLDMKMVQVFKLNVNNNIIVVFKY